MRASVGGRGGKEGRYVRSWSGLPWRIWRVMMMVMLCEEVEGEGELIGMSGLGDSGLGGRCAQANVQSNKQVGASQCQSAALQLGGMRQVPGVEEAMTSPRFSARAAGRAPAPLPRAIIKGGNATEPSLIIQVLTRYS